MALVRLQPCVTTLRAGGLDPLLDHVVIGDGRYFSFTDQNLL
jgi:DNA repair protein RadC